jgi:dephospho-CoA kinase
MIIGLTGNSGCGKSRVADIMRDEYGAFVIDADKVGHEVLLRNGKAYAETVAEFGEGILNADGEIDRRKLGGLIFGDESQRGRLMEITHKYIVEEMLNRLETARGAYPYVVMDAPLLVEAGLHEKSDAVWLVWAPPEQRLARIIARDRLTEAEAGKRIGSQTGYDELKKYADAVIDNSKGLEELREEVKKARTGKFENLSDLC